MVANKVTARGGVERRENSLRIHFRYGGVSRKETIYDGNAPMKPSPSNHKHALRMAEEIRQKIKHGTFDYAEYFPHSKYAPRKAPTNFGEFIDHWYAQLLLKKSTMDTYRRYKDSLWKPRFGHLELSAVKHSDITLALSERKSVSGKTRNNILAILKNMFTLAVADKLIKSNPCDDIPLATVQVNDPDPFSKAEADAIIAHMKKHYHAQVANFFEFQFFSGLRTSEAFGLEWSEVDLENKTVHVRRAFVVNAIEESTKTFKPRTVSLNSRAFAALTSQRKWTYGPNNRVFHDPGTNKPWAYEQNARKRYWIPTLKALKYRYRRPYNTRHTYATLGLMAGVNPAFMALQLGHSLRVLLKRYAKWLDGEANKVEMEKIERSIKECSPDTP